jgi:hypothetical protein
MGGFFSHSLKNMNAINWRHDELFDFYCKVLMQLTKDEYLQLPYVLNHCEANRHPFHIILED